MMGIGFVWVSTASVATPYEEIVGQMFFLGVGLGMTTAPAAESIMGSLSADKAGIGSAVNDTTRELGGTLGVAILGSVFSSVYIAGLDDSPAIEALPESRPRSDRGVGRRGPSSSPRSSARPPPGTSTPSTRRSSPACRRRASSPRAQRSPAPPSPPASCLPGRSAPAAALNAPAIDPPPVACRTLMEQWCSSRSTSVRQRSDP